MSRVIKWQYNDLIESRRNKLVNLLLTEIIFLKSQYKTMSNKINKECVENALDKLDYLLNILKNSDLNLGDNDFDKIIIIIYNIFKEIVQKIEK
jgi:hypothetical protein